MVANGMDPQRMTSPERIEEVSTLLSLAMMRLWLKRRKEARQASMDERGISTKSGSIPLASSRNDGSV